MKQTKEQVEERLGRACRRYRAPEEVTVVVPYKVGRKYVQVIGFRNGRLRLFRLPKSETKWIGPMGGGNVVEYPRMGRSLLEAARRSPPNVTRALWALSQTAEDVL